MTRDVQITWTGFGEKGLKHGRFRDESGAFAVAISVPGLGGHTQATVHINGQKVFKSGNLEASARAARLYFQKGMHVPREPQRVRSR